MFYGRWKLRCRRFTQIFNIFPLYVYSVKHDNDDESYGGLFYSEVLELGQLPLESEIGQISYMKGLPSDLTYPAIQPELYDKGLKKLSIRGQGHRLNR